MPLKESTGNMYPWVSHTHCHLGGQCPHRCVYCYVDHPRWGRPARYQGELRLIEAEFKVKYGSGKTIFVENCNDLFAAEVPHSDIQRVLGHCKEWPDNTYVLQSKNPGRIMSYVPELPPNVVVGATIETNRDMQGISAAPAPTVRMLAMEDFRLRFPGIKRFVTIEPVLDFDTEILAAWIDRIRPDFLNLGADSKNHHLPEPTVAKILELAAKLHAYGIELREKHNLKRLKAA